MHCTPSYQYGRYKVEMVRIRLSFARIMNEVFQIKSRILYYSATRIGYTNRRSRNN